MKTKYGIPQKVLDEIVSRSRTCVYCGKLMNYTGNVNNRTDNATIEHLNHRQEVDSVRRFLKTGRPLEKIICICCGSCNSSRGSKSLLEWFKSDYCKGANSMQRHIDEYSVDIVVREYIDRYEKGNDSI